MKNNRFWCSFVIAVSGCLGSATTTKAAPLMPLQNQPANCKLLTQLLLTELGVTPEALAAVNASDVEVSIIVAAARGMCETSGGSFASAQQSIEQLRADIQALEKKVQSGEAHDEDVEHLAQARLDMEGAVADRQGIVEQVRVLVEGALGTQQIEQLHNIAAARKVSVPVQYKVVSRTEDDWTSLRDYLGEKARADREGIAGPPNRQEPAEVDLAGEFVSERLTDVRLTWRAALTD